MSATSVIVKPHFESLNININMCYFSIILVKFTLLTQN